MHLELTLFPAVTLSSKTTFTVTTNIISGIPNTLLPDAATLYGSTVVDGKTVATFPSQTLTVASPTPFWLFTRGIEMYTSWECPVPETYTSVTTKFRTTIDGTPTITSGYFSAYTTTPLPDGVHAGGYNHFLNLSTVARAFPDGDYSDFNFTEWMDHFVTGPSAGDVDAYSFFLPADFAEFFASIPYVKEEYPDIGKCTPLIGGGEPTVHVPVNQLTDTSHVTLMMTGNLKASSTAPKTTEAQTTKEPETTKDQGQPTSTPKETQQSAPPAESQPITHDASTADSGQTADTTSSPEPTTSPDIVSVIQETTGSQGVQDSPVPIAAATPVEATQGSSPTSAKIGAIIASVIGLVPSAAAEQEAASNPAPAAITFDDSSQTIVPSGPAHETPAPAAQITIGSSLITANSASAFVVGTETLAPGGPAITLGGTTFAIPSQATALVVNGETTPIGQPQTQKTPAPAQIPVGGSVVTANGASQFEIGSQTLIPGGSAITIDDSVVSLAPSATAVVINGVTTPVAGKSANVPAVQITIGGSTITADSASQFQIASQTLSPGGPAITVSGTTYSLAPSGSAIVVDGVTSQVAVPQGSPITFGSDEVATPIASGAYVLQGGQTLSPGGSVVVGDGTTYSLAPSGSVVINGVTSAMPTAGSTIIGMSQDSGTELILDGTTLSPGSTAVVSGTTYSLPAMGGGIYVNGQSSALPSASPGAAITLPNGIVATPTIATELAFGSQTLSPGSEITVSGTTYSLSGSDVIVKASSTTFTEAASQLTRVSSASPASSSSASSAPETTRSTEPSGGVATPTTSQSGASRVANVLGGTCLTILSVALFMCWM